MERGDDKVSYIGKGLKQGIVVDPDFMTWSCFDGLCEEYSIEGGLVERVWWMLPHEEIDTVRKFIFLGSDAEFMRMCGQAMSTSREIDVFLEQGNIVLMRIEEESEKAVEKECEHAAEMDWEQSAGGGNESEKVAAAENESQKALAADNESENAPRNESENAPVDDGAEPADEIRGDVEEAMRKAKRKKNKKGKPKIFEDEEDIGERYDVEIEDAVNSFVDEGG